MKKRIALLLAALLAVGSLSACGGTDSGNGDATVNVGLGLHTQMDYSSKNAGTDEEGNPTDGLAQADLTVAAVTLNADGTIAAVKVDAIQVKTNFDATGTITSDTAAEILTKRELGADYNMKGVSASIGKIEGGAEWFEQADAFEGFCVGKTIEEVKAAMNAEQYPSSEDLLAGCTMKINGFVAALEKACAEAATGTYTASATDALNVAIVAEVSNPASASAEAEGAATAYANFVAVTSADGAITTCILDSVQAKFAWDTTGVITSDLTVDTTTKYDLKEGYGMKEVSKGNGVIADGGEWYEQADAFMGYVKGMTAEQVAGIAMNEGGYPTDENLTAGCTMKVAAYVKAVSKALAK
ncbi:MAG: hypothetical protein IJO60_03520 [Agathobacter sp.]|nr:hypothetical protein [Agathobacter sp.]